MPDPVSVTENAALAGPVDVPVNNAGLPKPGPVAALPLAEWNYLLAVNLTGYFLCAQAFGVAMPERRSGAYRVSKAGIAMLSPHAHERGVLSGVDRPIADTVPVQPAGTGSLPASRTILTICSFVSLHLRV